MRTCGQAELVPCRSGHRDGEDLAHAVLTPEMNRPRHTLDEIHALHRPLTFYAAPSLQLVCFLVEQFAKMSISYQPHAALCFSV